VTSVNVISKPFLSHNVVVRTLLPACPLTDMILQQPTGKAGTSFDMIFTQPSILALNANGLVDDKKPKCTFDLQLLPLAIPVSTMLTAQNHGQTV